MHDHRGLKGDDNFRHGARIHVAVDEESKPITLSPENMHDSKVFSELYDKPKGLYADSAYDTDEA